MVRILLVGFMGAGKTTLGKALGKSLGVSFVDLDQYIVSRFRKSISQLFQEKGEEGFRLVERNMLHEVAEFEEVVVATGGGTPCFFDNMAYMNSRGITVYLNASQEVLFTRLTIAKQQRPLLAEKSPEELKGYIQQTLQQRELFYQQAQHTFQADWLENASQIHQSVQRFMEEIPLHYRL